jgi:molybdenum cofactor synthesis domain-containing protein
LEEDWMSNKTAAILIVGNEILSGRTRDKNACFLTCALKSIGVLVKRIVVIPDVVAQIVAEVNALRSTFDYVVVCGGIGPTPDDVTRPAVAAAFGVPCEPHAGAVCILHEYYQERITPRRLVMAELPRGAALIPNPTTGAPGFAVENVFVLPGIPALVEAMFAQVAARMEHAPFAEVEFPVALPESEFADVMDTAVARFPAVEIGSYPSCDGGTWRCALVIKGGDAIQVQHAREWLQAAIAERAENVHAATR